MSKIIRIVFILAAALALTLFGVCRSTQTRKMHEQKLSQHGPGCIPTDGKPCPAAPLPKPKRA